MLGKIDLNCLQMLRFFGGGFSSEDQLGVFMMLLLGTAGEDMVIRTVRNQCK